LSIFRSANFQGQNLIQGRLVVNSPEGEGRNQKLFFSATLRLCDEQMVSSSVVEQNARRSYCNAN